MSFPQVDICQDFIHCLIMKIHAQKKKPDFISSILDDDCIQRLGENNWQWLCCHKTFQGINAAKALA